MLAWAFILPAQAQVKIPPPREPVVDKANLFSPAFERQMNQALKTVQLRNGPQIGVLTLPDIESETIEQTSIRVAEQWKLGTAEGDKGAIIVIAVEQKQVRIEVGQGLEGDLTDFESSKIINDLMLPLFKNGEFPSGLLVGVARIIQITAPDIDVEALFSGQNNFKTQSVQQEPSAASRVISILIFIGAIFMFIKYPRLFLLILLSGAGRRGGGFGGGGGWSGGGGGFSGGGASGGW